MKRSRFLLSTLTAAALAALTFSGCEKKAPDKPQPPQAGQVSTTGASATGEAPKAAPVAPAPPAAPAEVAKLAGTYGFVARLPKDVEGFSASYRLHDLWEGLSNSKWAATLLELPPVKENAELGQLKTQWNSEQGQQARALLEAFFGNEFEVIMPAGFTAKLEPWMELFGVYQQTVLQAYFMMGMGGGAPNPQKMQQMIRDAAPEFIPVLSKCEVPPFIFAFKAGKMREFVDGVTKQAMQMVGSELPPAFEPGQFKLGDKYDFQSISVNAKKLVAQFQEVQLELQLKEILGDEAKAKEALEAIVSKRVELAWGWVDDYFVVSIGSDHNHLKLASGEADSVLSLGEIAKRGGQFAAQRPLGLSYISKPTFEMLEGKLEFADQFKAFAEELQGILKPEQIEAMVADVRRLESKAQALFTTTYQPMVQVDLWEGGFRSELFGGPQQKAVDASKPLTFGALTTATTLMSANGRSNEAHSKAMADFIEDAAATLWSWYEKYGRTMVPETERQGAAMIEATAKPMIVDFWRATRTLGRGLGAESALLLDLGGAMPKLPDLPPFLADGKILRIAWVSELKDRAAIAEAWKGYWTLIKQLAAIADQTVPEPQMKQEGDAELHFVPLPIPTDDLLPHIAITKERWILSTSPSYTKEIVANKPAATGGPMGTHVNVNFAALFDFAQHWVGVVDKHSAQMLGEAEAAKFKAARPLIDAAVKLGRSLRGFEWHVHEEGGQPRNSVRLKIQDLP